MTADAGPPTHAASSPPTASALAEVAAQLYALTPDAFTAARDARAADAEDAALGRAIRALRKPVVAAWVVGELARSAAPDLAAALELAAQLREAQAELDAPALATLNRQRRSLVSALAAKAGALARERGVAASPATLDAVERTLNAAMRDAGASAAVTSGRLIRPLEASGVDPVDLTDAVAGGLDAIALAAASEPPRSRDDLAERRARREAERAVSEARRAATDAARALERIDARARTARQRAVLLAERVETMRAELARLERDAAAAEDEAAALADERRAAASAARAAEAASARAASALSDDS